MRKIYVILPRRYKKNLKDLYIIHSTARVHMFFQLSKLFLGAHVSRIVKFIPCVADVQAIISPILLRFPPSYLQWEDTNYVQRERGELPTLVSLFDCSLGAPTFVVQCVEYLRYHGMSREGIFRVAGDQISLEVGRNRFREGCRYVLIGRSFDEGAANHLSAESPESRRARSERRTTPAYLLLDDVDEIAQVVYVICALPCNVV